MAHYWQEYKLTKILRKYPYLSNMESYPQCINSILIANTCYLDTHIHAQLLTYNLLFVALFNRKNRLEQQNFHIYIHLENLYLIMELGVKLIG